MNEVVIFVDFLNSQSPSSVALCPGESTSEELGTSVPCTEKTFQGAELVADGDSHCVALQSEFHSTRELNCVNLIVFLLLVVLSMLLWRSRSLRGVVNFVEILF